MIARLHILRSQLVSMEMNVIGKVLGYLLLFLIATIIFTYVRFPSASLKPLVEKVVAQAPVEIEMSDVSLTFPPGLKLTNVRISDPKGRKGVDALSIETLNIKPSYLSIITGSLGGSVTAKLLGGELFVHVISGSVADGSVDLEFDFDGLDPSQLTIWENFKWAKLGGSLSGEGALSITDGDILKSSGDFKANLSGGEVTISKALAGDRPSMTLDKGALEFGLDSGKVKIKRAFLKGPEMDAKLSGDIILSHTPRFSRLNLKAALKTSGDLDEKIGPLLSLFKKNSAGAVSVKISGTLAAPVTR